MDPKLLRTKLGKGAGLFKDTCPTHFVCDIFICLETKIVTVYKICSYTNEIKYNRAKI